MTTIQKIINARNKFLMAGITPNILICPVDDAKRQALMDDIYAGVMVKGNGVVYTKRQWPDMVLGMTTISSIRVKNFSVAYAEGIE